MLRAAVANVLVVSDSDVPVITCKSVSEEFGSAS